MGLRPTPRAAAQEPCSSGRRAPLARRDALQDARQCRVRVRNEERARPGRAIRGARAIP